MIGKIAGLHCFIGNYLITDSIKLWNIILVCFSNVNFKALVILDTQFTMNALEYSFS